MNLSTPLLLAAVLGIVAALVFWPRIGLHARWDRLRRNVRRVLIEDALKHVYDYEYKKLVCTPQSLSGALSISGDEAAKLLGRLETLGLIRLHGEGVGLTDEGRLYALRIIRVHRLWERYLADETGIHEIEWHPRAEKKEHRIPPEEADALAAQMGNPTYDPHGDPIPTASGYLPTRKGKALTQLHAGELAEVVHVEDEPAAVYAQIVAQGLYPGVRIRIIGVSKERIHFDADGIEKELSPVAATNVAVVSLSSTAMREGPFETLAALNPGEKGTVISISRACRGQQRRRLMDLGVVPGTVITAEMRSASGDPTAYAIRDATIALRKQQATMIHIRRNEGRSS